MYGNPFSIGDKDLFENRKMEAEDVVKYYDWAMAYADADIIGKVQKLKGKNLACWCSLDQPCHADVLLKLANE